MIRRTLPLLLLGALALGACGGDDDEPARAGATSAAESGAFPVTIRSKFGSATIEREPRRVVTLDNQATDDALALGVRPVGISKVTYVEGDVQAWTEAALGDGAAPALLDTDAALPYERIAALEPDLILAPHTYLLDRKAHDRLERIAPTVHFEKGTLLESWQSTMRRVGQALGRPARAEDLVAQTEKRLAAARRATPAFEGATVNIFNAVGTGLYAIDSPQDSSLRLLGQLGMRLDPDIDRLPGESGRAVISAERYDLLDAGLIIGTSGESPAVLRKLERDKLFSRVPAVREGRYVGLPIGPATSMAFPSVLSVDYALREVVPQLAEAIGDPASAKATFPVEIRHRFGTTRIAEEPQRVVNAGYTELDTLLGLGVRPVATREFLGGYDWRERPWAPDGGGDLEIIGAEELNLEAVATQRPDLIVALNAGLTKGDYRRLSKIAPTIAQSGEYVDYGMPWQEQTRTIGRALGREARAQELVSGIERRFAAARREHPGFAKAAAVLAYGGKDGWGAYTSQDTRSRFLTDLGFELPREIDRIAGGAFHTELSRERFRLLDQDAVLFFGDEREVERDRVFGRTQAVKQDRVVYLDLGDQIAGALGFSSVLSLPYLLDEAVPKLAAAVDGDPETAVIQPR